MALTATPFVPYTVVSNLSVDSVFYPSTVTSDAKFYLDGLNGFSAIDFDSASPNLNFTVSGFDATNRYLLVYAEGTSSGSFSPVPIGSCSSPTGCVYSFDSGGASAINISISPLSICDPNHGGASGAQGCTSTGAPAGSTAHIDQTTNPIAPIRLRFVSSTTTPAGSAAPDTGYLLQLYPERAGPRITACPLAPGFFPGDSAILVDTSGFTVTPDTTNGGSSPVFNRVWVSAEPGDASSVPADRFDATIHTFASYGTGSTEINGFKNSTQAVPYLYGADYGVEDSAGILAFCGDPPSGSVTNSGYPLSNVFSTDIQGFLRESNCFVATASFRNGRAPGVMLLRHFRDEFLEHHALGRDFIGWYYANGPTAAEWLIEHPIFRSVSLMFLLPLQAVAWITLHPASLFVPSLSLFLLFGFLAFSRKRRHAGFWIFPLFFIVATLFAAIPKALAADQPYIDSLISELPKDPNAATPENPDPYIQSIKRKIGKGDDPTGYTETMKKRIAPSDGSEGYAERIQKTLPKSEGSAIEDYRKGKKLHANKGSLDTRNAFGFNLIAGATRTYTAGANQDVAYETVYGNGWVPDFTLHYEWRPFTSSFLKKFGLYSSAGASFTKANGIFNFTDNGAFDSHSRTEFKFIVLPVNVGLIYRFSLFDFMWPYFGAGPSAIGFVETRNDKQKGHHGYDLGYWFLGGVAFGLDWMSPSASWNQYETATIKHSYFTIDYSYLESVAGGLVEFTVDGVQLGFTFEL
jgi:hypothetical protein